jgi:hypothetical protein
MRVRRTRVLEGVREVVERRAVGLETGLRAAVAVDFFTAVAGLRVVARFFLVWVAANPVVTSRRLIATMRKRLKIARRIKPVRRAIDILQSLGRCWVLRPDN